jgi:transcriptional regulator with XRE-family HTH domain
MPDERTGTGIRDDLDSLAPRLRALRKARGLTLTAAASGCGISPSMLSQAERGLVVPSLNTLYALAQVYGVSLFTLFVEGSPSATVDVVTRHDRRRLVFTGSNEVYDVITPAARRSMSVFELTILPDHGTFDHGMAHAGDEGVLVLAGAARIVLNGSPYHLETGDALFYDGTIHHNFESAGPDPVRLLVIVTPAL